MKLFKIIALDEHDDISDRLFWSNEDGWTIGGDYFTLSDVWAMDLPQGGAWVAVEVAYDKLHGIKLEEA